MARWRDSSGQRRGVDLLLALVLLVAVALAGYAVHTTTDDDAAAASTTEPAASAGPDEAERQHDADVSAALAATTFPDLRPGLDRLGTDAWISDAEKGGCADGTVETSAASTCRTGPDTAPGLAIVLGDDAAVGYVPAVEEALGTQYRVQQITLRGCPVWDVAVREGDACDRFRVEATAEIARLHPDLLFVATSYGDAAMLASGATDQAAVDEVTRGYTAALDALRAAARFTVVLQPPPGGADLTTCDVDGAAPSTCVQPVSDLYRAGSDVEQRVAAGVGALFVPTTAWFCSADLGCPAFVGDRPVYADGVHVVRAYARSLGPVLRSALDRFAQQHAVS